MNKKFLTIIIPMCNMEKYIEQCLSSLVIDRGMEHMEVLVVNDGSTDQSPDIACHYAQRYPQTFRVINKENGHYGSCINRGLTEAQGKFVRILDADDFYDRHHLADFLDYLSTITDVDMVYTDFCLVSESGKTIKTVRHKRLPGRIYGTKHLFPHLHINMHSVTYRTQMLRDIHYRQTEGIAYTDQEWIFQPMASVERWVYYPRVIYHYRIGRLGQSVSPEQVVRCISQEIQGMMGMVKLYENLRRTLSEDAVTYLRSRLSTRGKVIFKRFLLYHYDALSSHMNDLINMDEEICHLSPDTYTLLGQLSYHILGFKYRFVHKWRTHGYNPMLPGLRYRRRKDAIKG